MKKLILSLILFCTIFTSADAKNIKKDLNKLIENSAIPKESIAVSVKDTENGKTVFALNDKMLMHPASIQKILTLVPAVDILGENYNFKTTLYKRDANSYLIELGADPYLTSADLYNLTGSINKSDAKKIFIDDSIIELKDWGEGWQWDDDLNISMPRFNSYNMDDNIYRITVLPTVTGEHASTINVNKAPIVIINDVITSDRNGIDVKRNTSIAPNAMLLTGKVKTPETISITNNNLKSYFNTKLTQSLEDRNIYLKEPYYVSTRSASDHELFSISHPIDKAIDDILKNSNNMVSETLLKLSANKANKKTGTDVDGIKLFYSYCNKAGLDCSGIRIVDASGVSKNNLVYADFMTNFLIANKDSKVLEKMAIPGEGTLTFRLVPIREFVRAKTGTLSDISSITGFVTTKKGKNYTFCIMINDPNTSSSAKKNLEDYLIREMYLNL